MEKPSFLKSTWEGIKGYIKGGFAGMAIGAVVIGGIAALVGAFAPEAAMGLVKAVFGSSADAIITYIAGPVVGTSAAATAASITPALSAVAGSSAAVIPTLGAGSGAALGAIGGAAAGSAVFSQLGAISGAFTGVVKSRETPPEHLIALGREAAMRGHNIGLQKGIQIGQGTKHQDALHAQTRNVGISPT